MLLQHAVLRLFSDEGSPIVLGYIVLCNARYDAEPHACVQVTGTGTAAEGHILQRTRTALRCGRGGGGVEWLSQGTGGGGEAELDMRCSVCTAFLVIVSCCKHLVYR